MEDPQHLRKNLQGKGIRDRNPNQKKKTHKISGRKHLKPEQPPQKKEAEMP